MTTGEELKPCPFCGSNEVDIHHREHVMSVFCWRCSASSGDHYSKEAMLKTWSNREYSRQMLYAFTALYCMNDDGYPMLESEIEERIRYFLKVEWR